MLKRTMLIRGDAFSIFFVINSAFLIFRPDRYRAVYIGETRECAAFITIKTRGADFHMYGVCARAMNILSVSILIKQEDIHLSFRFHQIHSRNFEFLIMSRDKHFFHKECNRSIFHRTTH